MRRDRAIGANPWFVERRAAMPASDCIQESSNRLQHTRNRIARQQTVVDAAEFKPLEFAFAVRLLKMMQRSLAALESSHAILVGLADPAAMVPNIGPLQKAGVVVEVPTDATVLVAARGIIAPESLSLREIKEVCLALIEGRTLSSCL
jgi:hypothetical protein